MTVQNFISYQKYLTMYSGAHLFADADKEIAVDNFNLRTDDLFYRRFYR